MQNNVVHIRLTSIMKFFVSSHENRKGLRLAKRDNARELWQIIKVFHNSWNVLKLLNWQQPFNDAALSQLIIEQPDSPTHHKGQMKHSDAQNMPLFPCDILFLEYHLNVHTTVCTYVCMCICTYVCMHAIAILHNTFNFSTA